MALRFCIIMCVIVLGLGTSSSLFAQEKTRISAPSLPRPETAQLYNDAWWKAQYTKIYDTPRCREIITNVEKIRAFDRQTGLLTAPMVWAIGMYSAKGECGDPAPDEAFDILTDLAERGEGLPSVLLAHFHHIKHGAKAPVTQSWMERAKNAVPRIITKNWRGNWHWAMV